MTLLAAHTKLAIVNIIFSVASQTIAAHWRRIFVLGSLLGMATLASDLHVRSVQRVLGSLVVIEIPQGPGTGVVATLATHTQFLFVLVFFLVT